jgi:hypothetical protein
VQKTSRWLAPRYRGATSLAVLSPQRNSHALIVVIAEEANSISYQIVKGACFESLTSILKVYMGELTKALVCERGK